MAEPAAEPPPAEAEDEEDVANAEAEEDFAVGMANAAVDYQAHDTDGDHKLDFDEFCALVRDRESGDHTEEELRARFEQLDADGSGQVDLHEYVRYSLRDALSRSSSRVIDLFKQWDDDGSGEIEKGEFRKAIKAMGFNFFANDAEIDLVFDDFDIDKSGRLDYKELNKQLRVGAGSLKDPLMQPGAVGLGRTGVKHKLRRKDSSEKLKGTKLRNVHIDLASDKSVQEQLRDILTANAVRVVDLFREWDEDGDGTVSKKEFGKALRAMGVAAEKADYDALFDTFDADKSGVLEYSELNRALRRGGSVQLDPSLQAGSVPIELKAKNKSSRRIEQATRPVQAVQKLKKGAASSPNRGKGGGGGGGSSSREDSPTRQPLAPTGGGEDEQADEDDVADGEGEEDFASGMRHAAADYQAHDTDGDHKLDFDEFCALVRDRESGDHTEEELRARFEQLDADGSGQVDLHEYVRYSLRDALSRSSSRVIDLFKQWDDDGSGEIEKGEFRKAIKAMGFNFFANDAEIDLVFDDFDIDKSGRLDYKELNKQLRVGAGSLKDPLMQPGAVGLGRTGVKHKLRRKDSSEKLKGTKLRNVHIDLASDKSVQEQLRDILTANAVRVVDLFREWDEDGDGIVTKKEFAVAIKKMGIEADREEVNLLFDVFDSSGDGKLEFSELNRALRRGSSVQLDPSLQAGSVHIELTARNKSNSFSGGSSPPRNIRKTTDELVMEDLWRSLGKNAARLMDLFRRWDTNGDGVIDRKEWLQAIPLIGVRASAEHINRLFDECDADGSGSIEYAELRSAVREHERKVKEDFKKSGGGAGVRRATAASTRSFGHQREPTQMHPPRPFTDVTKPVPKSRRAKLPPAKLPPLPDASEGEGGGGRGGEGRGRGRGGGGGGGRRGGERPSRDTAGESGDPTSGDEAGGGDGTGDGTEDDGDGERLYRQTRAAGENPFKAMQLALEAAPLSLRVIDMPASDDWFDAEGKPVHAIGAAAPLGGGVGAAGGAGVRGGKYGNGGFQRALDAAANEETPGLPGLAGRRGVGCGGGDASSTAGGGLGGGLLRSSSSRMELVLREQLDEMTASTNKAGRGFLLDQIAEYNAGGFSSASPLSDPAEEVEAIRRRRELARLEQAEKEEEERQQRAATTLQGGYRGMLTRQGLSAASRNRVWRFHRFHVREFDAPEGKNTARFHVQRNEVLEIVNVEGGGRLLLSATDSDGNLVVEKGVVYDSSAYAFLKPEDLEPPPPPHVPPLPPALQSQLGLSQSSSVAGAVAGAAGPQSGVAQPPVASTTGNGPLWSAPGEYEYVFEASPLVEGQPVQMQVKFRLEITLTGRDVVSEPPLPQKLQPRPKPKQTLAEKRRLLRGGDPDRPSPIAEGGVHPPANATATAAANPSAPPVAAAAAATVVPEPAPLARQQQDPTPRLRGDARSTPRNVDSYSAASDAGGDCAADYAADYASVTDDGHAFSVAYEGGAVRGGGGGAGGKARRMSGESAASMASRRAIEHAELVQRQQEAATYERQQAHLAQLDGRAALQLQRVASLPTLGNNGAGRAGGRNGAGAEGGGLAASHSVAACQSACPPSGAPAGAYPAALYARYAQAAGYHPAPAYSAAAYPHGYGQPVVYAAPQPSVSSAASSQQQQPQQQYSASAQAQAAALQQQQQLQAYYAQYYPQYYQAMVQRQQEQYAAAQAAQAARR